MDGGIVLFLINLINLHHIIDGLITIIIFAIPLGVPLAYNIISKFNFSPELSEILQKKLNDKRFLITWMGILAILLIVSSISISLSERGHALISIFIALVFLYIFSTLASFLLTVRAIMTNDKEIIDKEIKRQIKKSEGDTLIKNLNALEQFTSKKILENTLTDDKTREIMEIFYEAIKKEYTKGKKATVLAAVRNILFLMEQAGTHNRKNVLHASQDVLVRLLQLACKESGAENARDVRTDIIQELFLSMQRVNHDLLKNKDITAEDVAYGFYFDILLDPERESINIDVAEGCKKNLLQSIEYILKYSRLDLFKAFVEKANMQLFLDNSPQERQFKEFTVLYFLVGALCIFYNKPDFLKEMLNYRNIGNQIKSCNPNPLPEKDSDLLKFYLSSSDDLDKYQPLSLNRSFYAYPDMMFNIMLLSFLSEPKIGGIVGMRLATKMTDQIPSNLNVREINQYSSNLQKLKNAVHQKYFCTAAAYIIAADDTNENIDDQIKAISIRLDGYHKKMQEQLKKIEKTSDLEPELITNFMEAIITEYRQLNPLKNEYLESKAYQVVNCNYKEISGISFFYDRAIFIKDCYRGCLNLARGLAKTMLFYENDLVITGLQDKSTRINIKFLEDLFEREPLLSENLEDWFLLAVKDSLYAHLQNHATQIKRANEMNVRYYQHPKGKLQIIDAISSVHQPAVFLVHKKNKGNFIQYAMSEESDIKNTYGFVIQVHDLARDKTAHEKALNQTYSGSPVQDPMLKMTLEEKKEYLETKVIISLEEKVEFSAIKAKTYLLNFVDHNLT